MNIIMLWQNNEVRCDWNYYDIDANDKLNVDGNVEYS